MLFLNATDMDRSREYGQESIIYSLEGSSHFRINARSGEPFAHAFLLFLSVPPPQFPLAFFPIIVPLSPSSSPWSSLLRRHTIQISDTTTCLVTVRALAEGSVEAQLLVRVTSKKKLWLQGLMLSKELLPTFRH